MYVKIFVKLKNNEVNFYKDGYTDICGKFNYVNNNNDMLADIK